MSTPKLVKCGVPQGTILGPLGWLDRRGHVAGTCCNNKTVCSTHTHTLRRHVAGKCSGHIYVSGTKSQHLHAIENDAGTCPTGLVLYADFS